MASPAKLVRMQNTPARTEATGGISPDLKEFIDRCIVPALVREYIANAPSQKVLDLKLQGIGDSRLVPRRQTEEKT
jgi:hypothetical protein